MKHPANINEVMLLQPDYLGFIFHKASKRYIESLSADFVSHLDNVKKVGVFVNDSLNNIQEAINRYGLHLIQLHGEESPAFVEKVKMLDVQVIKAFGISDDFDWKLITPYEGIADYYLFDTKTAHYGGSGSSFDWLLLQQYDKQTPYFLSGGLGPINLGEVNNLTDERLHAVDVNSKFESSPGMKDIQLLQSVFG